MIIRHKSPSRRKSGQRPWSPNAAQVDRCRYSRAAAFDSRRARRAGARDRTVRRAEAAAGLHPFLLRQSGRAEGRPAHARRFRLLRQSQPADHQGRRRQRHPRLHHREPDGARARRAVHALRPRRRDGRGAGGPLVDHLQSQPQGALLGRHTDYRRRRDLLLAAPEGEGPPQPPHLLLQGGEGRALLRPRACASPSMLRATARSRSSSV